MTLLVFAVVAVAFAVVQALTVFLFVRLVWNLVDRPVPATGEKKVAFIRPGKTDEPVEENNIATSPYRPIDELPEDEQIALMRGEQISG